MTRKLRDRKEVDYTPKKTRKSLVSKDKENHYSSADQENESKQGSEGEHGQRDSVVSMESEESDHPTFLNKKPVVKKSSKLQGKPNPQQKENESKKKQQQQHEQEEKHQLERRHDKGKKMVRKREIVKSPSSSLDEEINPVQRSKQSKQSKPSKKSKVHQTTKLQKLPTRRTLSVSPESTLSSDEEETQMHLNKKSKTMSNKEKNTTTTLNKENLRLEMENIIAEYDSKQNLTLIGSEEWKQKYEELYKLRYTESEILLKDARELLVSERTALSATINKLQHELTGFGEKLENQANSAKSKQTELEALIDVEKLKVIKLEKQNQILQKDNARLLKLASSQQFSPGGAAVAAASTACKVSDINERIARERKLIEIYRLLTGMQLTLLGNDGEDDEEYMDITEISCVAANYLNDRVFKFDLAFPSNPGDEIDYLPSGIYEFLPSYLNDEISFHRSELTKFTSTVLDILNKRQNPLETS